MPRASGPHVVPPATVVQFGTVAGTVMLAGADSVTAPLAADPKFNDFAKIHARETFAYHAGLADFGLVVLLAGAHREQAGGQQGGEQSAFHGISWVKSGAAAGCAVGM